MGWLVGGVWIGVGVFAVVILLFCLYELRWKSKRLQADLNELAALQLRLDVLRDEAGEAQRRLVQARADRERA